MIRKRWSSMIFGSAISTNIFMFKMDLILKNSMAQIYLTSYLLRGKWSTVALPRSNWSKSNQESTCTRISRGSNHLLVKTKIIYSLHIGKRRRLGQRHGLQNITLTSCYYKNIYRKVLYVYFYESIFLDKSIHIIFTFANSTS